MKLILAVALLFCQAVTAQVSLQNAKLQNANLSQPPPSGGGTCPADGSPNVVQTGSTDFLHANSDAPFIGQVFQTGTTWHPCKVRFKLTATSGSTGNTITARIFALSGSTITPASPLATSDPITWTGSWSLTDVIFTFSTPPTLSASTDYAIVLTSDGGSGTGNIILNYKGTASIAGHSAGWFSDGSQFNPADGTCCVMAIYWF